jgi:ATP-dependent DNA helicase RecQ
MKQKPIVAVSNEEGTVRAPENIHHPEFGIDSGKTAILTVTNEQTLQMAHLLRLQGKHVRLIQATDSFRFINLVEVRYFFKQLGNCQDGSISPKQWNEAKQHTVETYSTSKCLGILKQFLTDFEATHKSYYRNDLREFALESNIEDFITDGGKTFFVSTIHKAKGREFDTVHLLLGGIQRMDSDMLRAIYVGITRAKHHLYIYNDTSFLISQPSIALSLSMHDVWLDFFRNRIEQVLRLRSGDKMKYANGYLLSEKGEYISRLSTSMRDRMNEHKEKGYIVTDAEVSFVLAWRPPQENQEIAVCLANLVLSKSEEDDSLTPPTKK